MASAATTSAPFKFPGPVGTKRRRMRSGGNVSTMSNNDPVVTLDEADDVGEKIVQTSKCKGATTIPIFLKKTYKMIDTCDPNIASWTEEGDMFVVKDPEIFATQVIPQYFDHNKFSSFARQLNFYGFRKMQSKPIRNSDYDAGTAKHVTFYNENFKRGRCDLLKKIQRSTRGNGVGPGQDHGREIQMLREQVSTLEQRLQDTQTQMEERLRRLELDMLARMEQVMMAMQQQQHTQLQLHAATSVGTHSSGGNNNHNNPAVGMHNQRQPSWDPTGMAFARGSSVQSAVNNLNGGSTNVASANAGNGSNNNNANNSNTSMNNNDGHFPMPGPPGTIVSSSNTSGPTLPPHPKQKQLPPMSSLPGMVGGPPDRLNSLRGISMLSRGVSGLARGASVESSTSAVLLRNSWEDKFFSMLMLDENGNATTNNGGSSHGNNNGTTGNPGSALVSNGEGTSHAPMAPRTTSNGMTTSQTSGGGPVHISDRSLGIDSNGMPLQNSEPGVDDLSSVSSSDMP